VDTWSGLAELSDLARAWLVGGATTFGVWRDQDAVVRWPGPAAPYDGTADPKAFVSALIPGAEGACTLRVYGVAADVAQARLTADAALIGRIVAVNAELEAMADDLVESQDQLVALYDLTHSTKDLLSVDAVLASVTREAVRLTHAQAAIAIVGAETSPSIVQHPGPTLARETITDLLTLATKANRPVFQVAEGSDVCLPAGTPPVVVAPMELRGSRTAAIGLVSAPSRPFASPELKLVRTLADQAAARIENVLLHTEAVERARFDAERQVARKVQMQLLPTSTPTVPGIQAWARSLPALEVGGDFFDLILREDGSLVAVVGDVSGKGMPAALLMAMTRTVLRGMARFVPIIRSEAMLVRANDDLLDDFSEVGMFATAFVATYEPRTRELSYANAGHSPVIYCPAVGTPRLLTAACPPLGILPASEIDPSHLTLGVGDVLVAATDGFNEAWSPSGELFGFERLVSTIQGLVSGSAAEIGAGLFAAVEAFGGGRHQDDDQTLIVLKGVSA
jgi:sigma-B regulation protein RsbU (phosphoserine phosphatase)